MPSWSTRFHRATLRGRWANQVLLSNCNSARWTSRSSHAEQLCEAEKRKAHDASQYTYGPPCHALLSRVRQEHARTRLTWRQGRHHYPTPAMVRDVSTHTHTISDNATVRKWDDGESSNWTRRRHVQPSVSSDSAHGSHHALLQGT